MKASTRNCTEALHTKGWYPRLKRHIAKAIAHSLQDKQEGKFGDQAHLITTIAEVNIARAVTARYTTLSNKSRTHPV